MQYAARKVLHGYVSVDNMLLVEAFSTSSLRTRFTTSLPLSHVHLLQEEVSWQSHNCTMNGHGSLFGLWKWVRFCMV